MNKRKIKKQIKKVVGYMAACGEPVYNCVSNPEYTGGTCVARDEDCYSCEIIYTRKRYGAPLLLTNKMMPLYKKIHNYK